MNRYLLDSNHLSAYLDRQPALKNLAVLYQQAGQNRDDGSTIALPDAAKKNHRYLPRHGQRSDWRATSTEQAGRRKGS